jgi:autotransporter-associated beta strand protein
LGLALPAGSTGDPSTAGLSTGGFPYNLTKVGPNGVYLVSATVDPMLADITVLEGTLAFEGNTTSMGDPNKTLTIEAGAMLQFYRTTNHWDKKIVLKGSGTNNTVNNASWTNTLIAPITLQGECVINAGGDLLIFNGPLGGNGSLTKVGGSTLVLGALNNYTGATVVSNGTLLVTGQIQASSAVVVHGGTLAGSGTIAAPVAVNSGGSISPGEGSFGTLNVGGTLSLGGTSVLDADKTGTSLTSDLIQGVSTLTYGGTLDLNLTGDPLAVGDQFKLFNASTYAGAFAAIVPATPGAGLAWDTSSLIINGTLKVIVAPPPSPSIGTIKFTGGNLEMSGTGGTPGATFYVLGSANVASPLNTWTPVLTNSFDAGGNFSISLPVDSGTPQRFYTLQLP